MKHSKKGILIDPDKREVKEIGYNNFKEIREIIGVVIPKYIPIDNVAANHKLVVNEEPTDKKQKLFTFKFDTKNIQSISGKASVVGTTPSNNIGSSTVSIEDLKRAISFK